MGSPPGFIVTADAYLHAIDDGEELQRGVGAVLAFGFAEVVTVEELIERVATAICAAA